MKYVKNVTKIGKLDEFTHVILVSKSPRRNELLKNICEFESTSTDIDERKIEKGGKASTSDYLLFRASSKIFAILVVKRSIATVLLTPSGMTISA